MRGGGAHAPSDCIAVGIRHIERARHRSAVQGCIGHGKVVTLGDNRGGVRQLRTLDGRSRTAQRGDFRRREQLAPVCDGTHVERSVLAGVISKQQQR